MTARTSEAWVPMLVPGPPQPDTPLDALGWAAREAIETRGLDWYRAQYNAGWAAGGRSGDSAKWDSGASSNAWDDGYLDRAAGREKWHLSWCLLHDSLQRGGCGEA